VAVVRRIAGKVDRTSHHRWQEDTARMIDAEPLTWRDKVARWKAETGQGEVTFWTVLKRLKP